MECIEETIEKRHNDVRVQRVLGIHVRVTNLFATNVPTSRTIQGSLHSICKYGGEQRQHYCSYQDPHYTKCTSTEGFRRLITVPNEEKGTKYLCALRIM